MKRRIENYSWVASTGAITFTDFTAIKLEGVLVITNVTDQIIIYNFADAAKGGTQSANVLTCEFDTSSMDNTDKLQIWYDDGDVAEEVITKEFTFTDADGAQTNTALVTVSAGTAIVVTACDAVVGNDCTVDVGVRIGFAAATLTARATTGITGIVLSGTAFAAGSGIVKGSGAGKIGEGADGEDLRISSDDPVGGDLTVTVTYYTKAS